MQLGAANSITPSDLLGLSRMLFGSLDNVNAFSDTNIKALLNIEQKSLQAAILAALNFDWKENTVDGSGSGSLNLTAGTASIAFPTDMIQVDRIEVSYTGTVNSYRKATIVPMQAFTSAVSNNSNHAPIEGTTERPLVYIRNKNFYLDPIPYQSVTDGFKVWGETLLTDLSGQTDEPVFESAFHEILAYGAAEVWAASKDKDSKANRLFTKKQQKIAEMIAFYSNHSAEKQPRINPVHRSMR